MKNISKTSIFCFILVLIGIGLLTGAYFVNKDSKEFKKNSKTTVATISKIDRLSSTKKVYVNYTVDGQEYKDIKFNYYSKSMDVGETLNIAYNINNPTEIEGEGSSGMAAYIMMLLGIAFSFFGIFFFVLFHKKE